MDKNKTMTEKMIVWHEITPDQVEGRGWKNTEAPFDRLPAKIKTLLPQVWSNSRSTTGMCVFFDTDSTSLRAKWELGMEQIGEANFNVCAHCGVDLYIFDEMRNRWRWAAATGHYDVKDKHPESILFEGAERKMRRCLLYLPMRNQLLRLHIGVDDGAGFLRIPPRTRKPLVWYGTSIVHGAFAIRSGLGTPQIVARNLDLPLINLGFSGAAKLEKEMAELLAELDAELFVIDPYHNLTPESAAANTEQFIEILCSAHPGTPVFMLGAPEHFHAWMNRELKKNEDEKFRIYSGICRKMRRRHPSLHFVAGRNFYGSDEVSMDGVHPNDLAYARMADIMTGILQKELDRLEGSKKRKET